jgi:hypothetical protein
MIEYGRCEVVESRPVVLSRTRARTGRDQRNQFRLLSDDDVRAIRWWAATEGAHLRLREQLGVLQKRYGVGRQTVDDVLKRHSYAAIDGPPLSARHWRSPADQRMSILMWLVWFLLTIRAPLVASRQTADATAASA